MSNCPRWWLVPVIVSQINYNYILHLINEKILSIKRDILTHLTEDSHGHTNSYKKSREPLASSE